MMGLRRFGGLRGRRNGGKEVHQLHVDFVCWSEYSFPLPALSHSSAFRWTFSCDKVEEIDTM